MIPVKAYATQGPEELLAPFEFERRELKEHDILVDILFSGVCHSDIHQAKAEWEPMIPSIYPMVPGHEIVGRISQVGGAMATKASMRWEVLTDFQPLKVDRSPTPTLTVPSPTGKIQP